MASDGMTGEAAWTALTDELDAWAADGKTADFWWRDDDAVAPSDSLDRLFALAAEFSAPLVLAVIPARLQPSLVELIQANSFVFCAQHGYAHDNHALAGQKKIELGGALDQAGVTDLIQQGRDRLDELIAGDDPSRLPMLVPPWNRIADEALQDLPNLGFAAVSCFDDKPSISLPNGLIRLNTHCDPINWRDERRFTGAEFALQPVLKRLRAYRAGDDLRKEPIGFMTHHLVHEAEVWHFTERLLSTVAEHPAARWCQPLDYH